MGKERIKKFRLEAESELRFEVDGENEEVVLELKSGMAGVFGTELVKGVHYVFMTGAKIAVFTWQGCVIELRGKTDVCYIAKETPMVMYLNAHEALELLRRKAELANGRGPVTMIVGPVNVGKSTLCRLLLNYAARMRRRPIFVDLDVGEGQISIPGTIGALLVQRPADVEEGFSQHAPLVYHYGHESPSTNLALYNMLVSRLAEVTSKRMQANRRANASGVIIDTCGWVKGDGYKQLTHAAQAFKVDIILVLDQEWLYHELVRDMPTSVKVAFLQKNKGVVERSQTARAEERDARVREYFYGLRKPLCPHSFDVAFSDAKIYKIGASALPFEMNEEDNLTEIVAVTPGPDLLHHILAVSVAASVEDDIIQSNIAGFICVTNVDMERQSMTVLSPQPQPLPKTVLLLSDLQFMDDR